MKIGIVGDIHLGINENKPLFTEYHMRCLDYIFRTFAQEGIKDIIFLGDIHDKRYSLSVKTIKQSIELFDNDFNQYFLLGNHDVTYKNSNNLNSVDILLGEKNTVVTDLAEEFIFDGKKFLLVPWLNKTNYSENMKLIENTNADVLLGHFDINGFEMIKGIFSRNKDVRMSLFKKFKHVVSGHFHCFSSKGNITYPGSVCQMTWNDHGADHKFGYFCTETDELTMIDIPYTIYDVIRIKKNQKLPDPKQYKDKIIKCYLYTRRTIAIEKFLSVLVDNCISVNVIDEQVMSATENFDIETHNMSILELWKKYLEETYLHKKDVVIVDKIFTDAYIKVTTGDVI